MKKKYVKLEKALSTAKEAALFVFCTENERHNEVMLDWKRMGYCKKKAIKVIESVGLRHWECKLWKGAIIIDGTSYTLFWGEMAEAFLKSLQKNGISSGLLFYD